jgi:hypothetical protein
MSRHPRRGLVALQIGLALVIVAAGCRKDSPAPPAPPAPPTTGPVTGFPDTPAGRAVAAHVLAAGASGPGAAAAYQTSLQQLRGQGADAVNVIVAAYRSSAPADYGHRSLLVEILAELEEPEALPSLIEIARTPIPKQDRLPDESLSPFVEEAIIRSVAIRGLARFVPTDRQAEDVLVALLNSDAAPVREAAARALWEASGRIDDVERRTALRRRIPVELQGDPETTLGPVSPLGANPALRPRSGK